MPELVQYGNTTYQPPATGDQKPASIEYPDCGETSLLNFFRIVLGKEGAFSPEYVKGFEEKLNLSHDKKPRAHQVFLTFFKDRPRFAQALTKEGHAAWSQVVSNLNADTENNPVQYIRKGMCEINAGVVNMLSVIDKLIPHETLTKPWVADLALLQKAKGGMDGLREDEKKKVETTLEQAADKLTELCKLFSREDFKLDWSCKEQKTLPAIKEVDVAFTINGRSAFTWQFMRGHFQIVNNSLKEHWRKAIQFNNLHLGDNIFLQSLFVAASDMSSPVFQPVHVWGVMKTADTETAELVVRNILTRAQEGVIANSPFPHQAHVILEKVFPEGDRYTAHKLWPLLKDFQKDLIERVPLLNCLYQGKLLHEVVEEGDMEKIKNLFKQEGFHVNNMPAHKLPINSPNFQGSTPLFMAIKKNNTDLIKFLIQKGALVNVGNFVGATPLHAAASFGNKDIVQILIDNKATLNAQDHFGSTPLHRAVSSEKIDIVKALLGGGARMDVKNKANGTPMDIAREKGYQEIEQLLEEHAAKQEGEGSKE